MSAQQKQAAMDAWHKHMKASVTTQKFLCFSSIAEADFCEAFRKGILADANLTDREKGEILAFVKS